MSDPVRTLAAVRYMQAARREIRPKSPAELARRLDPKFNVTPTIRLLSDVAVRSVTQPDQRDAVSTPPRTGKSRMLAVWTSVWALMNNPDLEVVIISYGDDLAEAHSREIRKIINEHHDFLGYRLAQDKKAVGRWRVEDHSGGVLAAGINSGVTGFGADLLIIDDPIKDATQADSKALREKVVNEYRATLSTRVHPGGSILVVMTRWHEADLVGVLVKQDSEEWRTTNVPAVSEAGVPDVLGRPPGVAMVSALGYSAAHFARRRRDVGERVWYALYMGVPRSPKGNLIKAAWLEDHRLAIAPPSPLYTVVSVDPSDSGEGDSCGLVAVSLFGAGRVALIADRSKPMTSDAWARAAVQLAIDVGASEIAVEAFAARETYTRLVREAVGRAVDDGKLHRSIRVSAWPPKGRTRVGDAVARSAGLLQALEVGRCALAGQFPDFEVKAVTWQAGQHQPDSLAALVIGFDVCVGAVGLEWDIAVPGGDTIGGAPDVFAPAAGGGSVTVMGDWMSRKIG